MHYAFNIFSEMQKYGCVLLCNLGLFELVQFVFPTAALQPAVFLGPTVLAFLITVCYWWFHFLNRLHCLGTKMKL